jgi:arylsulfatase A-like enzyme
LKPLPSKTQRLKSPVVESKTMVGNKDSKAGVKSSPRRTPFKVTETNAVPGAGGAAQVGKNPAIPKNKPAAITPHRVLCLNGVLLSGSKKQRFKRTRIHRGEQRDSCQIDRLEGLWGFSCIQNVADINLSIPARPARSVSFSAIVLLLGLAACSPAKQRLAPVFDLAPLLPLAEVRQEISRIDFGTQAARPHLASGWSFDEGGEGKGPTLVWSEGEESAVDFFLAAPRDLRADLRCAPFEGGSPSPQVVTVELNGRPAGTLSLTPGLHDYTLALPRAVEVAGLNRLTFRYRAVTRSGGRNLAVAWDLLTLRPSLATAAGPPRAEAGSLVLPFGSEVALYVEAPAASVLKLGGIQALEGAGRLVVAAQEEGKAEKTLETLEPGTESRQIDLPGRGRHLLRLVLRSVPDAPAVVGSLVVRRPALWAQLPSRKDRAVPAAVREAAAPKAAPHRPNVLIYLVDTLRADRIGTYGSGRPTSPRVDAFARAATLFEHSVAQAPWTRASVASIFTGLGPWMHGVQTVDDSLAEAAVTLPELLRGAGYRTAAFSTNGNVSPATGMGQGFDEFFLEMAAPRSSAVTPRVLAWLDAHASPKPFFLYVHTADPHAPYEPSRDDRLRFAPGARPEAGTAGDLKRVYAARGAERAAFVRELIPLYDGEVAGNDRSFGALLDGLKSRSLYDGTLIVFVADHGEELGEHGELGHAHDLYRELLDIPLIVKWPGQTRGERVPGLAQHVDLLPTILRAAGLTPPAGLPGVDLKDSGVDGLGIRRAFSHINYENRRGMSVVTGGWKAILPLSHALGTTPELYRLGPNGEEGPDRSDEDPVRAGWLVAQIKAEILRSQNGLKPTPATLDDEARRRLHALGYL